MPSPKTDSSTWWFFFPFKGLQVLDESTDLAAPIFDDFSIVSIAHISSIVPLLKLNSRMGAGHDHERDVVHLMTKASVREDFEGFVAVRRTGRREIRARDDELQSAAQSRAREVAALLGLTYLCDSDDAQTCGLVESIHRRQEVIAALDLGNGGFSMRIGGSGNRMVSSHRCIKASRAAIQKCLLQGRMRALSSLVIARDRRLVRSTGSFVVNAMLTLSDALHAPDAAARLLGAVTAVEILLSEQGDSYECFRRRVAALVGPTAVMRYEVDGVLQARHRFVHRGQKVDSDALALRAIALGLSCLLNCARHVVAGRSREQILSSLDFLTAAARIGSLLNTAEKKALAGMVTLRPRNHRFAFVKHDHRSVGRTPPNKTMQPTGAPSRAGG